MYAHSIGIERREGGREGEKTKVWCILITRIWDLGIRVQGPIVFIFGG